MVLDPRFHFVVATCIVARPREKEDAGKIYEYLIAKRAPHEKTFPNKWTVPGGKLVLTEYQNLPRTSDTYPQWYNVVEWVLRKEVREEVGLEIEQPKYLTDLVFVRPDGYPVVTLSYWAWHKSGEAKPGKDLTEVAWVTAAEAKQYDMIEGIAEEIEEVERIVSSIKC